MKKINAMIIMASLLLTGNNVLAEGTSLTNENIQGSWTLEYTKKSEKATETFEREDMWVFNKEGTVTIKNIPREGGYYDQFPVNYTIDGNKIDIAILGRMGKFDKFTLVNKDDTSMTLKARFGAIYQFSKK